jgi:hypothetical protein
MLSKLKLFVVAISVENEYAGRVLDVSWLLAKDLVEAHKYVQAHIKKTFRKGSEWGKWSDWEIEVEEVPTLLADQRGTPHEIILTVAVATSNDKPE